MQVLGKVPKKERKPKNPRSSLAQYPSAHVGAMSDPGLLQNKLKPRLMEGTVKEKVTGSSFSTSIEDADDVYAFPADSVDKQTKNFTALVPNVGNISIVGPSSGNSSYNAAPKNSNDTNSGQSSLAKIYPELAEKLEKIKPKVEAKVKGKVKSSRTMNSLQTKIAQNKIKDKLKRTQSSSNASSQSQSPSHSFISNSPGYHISTSSPNPTVSSPATPVQQNCVVSSEQKTVPLCVSQPRSVSNQYKAPSLPSLSNLNLLNGLNLQTLNLSLEQLGLPVPTVSDIEQTLKQLAKAANIPLDGSTLSDERTTQLNSKVPVGTNSAPMIIPPVQTFSPQSGPPPPYPGIHKTVSTVKTTQQTSPVKQSLPAGHQIIPISTPSINSPPVVNTPLVTRNLVSGSSQSEASTSVPTISSALSSPPAVAAASLTSITASFPSFPSNMHPKLTLLTSSQSLGSSETAHVPKEPVKQSPVKQTLPSPNVQQQVKNKLVKSKSRARNPSSASKRPVPPLALPMAVVKPRKLRKVLDENEVKTLKTKSAISLYNRNMKRKIDQHYLIYSGECNLFLSVTMPAVTLQ